MCLVSCGLREAPLPAAATCCAWNLSVKVYLNDLLSSGHIPDLYTKDEQLSIAEGLVEVVKAKGISPEPAACWNYFIQQV